MTITHALVGSSAALFVAAGVHAATLTTTTDLNPANPVAEASGQGNNTNFELRVRRDNDNNIAQTSEFTFPTDGTRVPFTIDYLSATDSLTFNVDGTVIGGSGFVAPGDFISNAVLVIRGRDGTSVGIDGLTIDGTNFGDVGVDSSTDDARFAIGGLSGDFSISGSSFFDGVAGGSFSTSYQFVFGASAIPEPIAALSGLSTLGLVTMRRRARGQ